MKQEKPTGKNFDRFTQKTRNTLEFAQEAAIHFQHNYVGTEHLLLGLVSEIEGAMPRRPDSGPVRDGGDIADRILSNLGVDLRPIRSAVESILGSDPRVSFDKIGLTSHARRVIELAVYEARRVKHDYIGTEHLLLGLLREGEAVSILESQGINLEKARNEAAQILSRSDFSNVSAPARGSSSRTFREWLPGPGRKKSVY